MQLRKLRTLTLMASIGALAIILAACGNSTAGTSASASVPAGLGVKSFDASFSVMAQLKSVTAAGKSKGGGILSHTTPSTRYVNFHLPYLKKTFDLAADSSSQYKIDNAEGDDATE